MDRRQFLRSAAASAGGAMAGGAAGVAAGGLAAPALAQGKRDLRMVTVVPKNFPGIGTGAVRIAERVSAMTEGRLSITVYGGGELVPSLESFDVVSTGAVEMYHAPEYFWQGKHRAYPFFCSVPMGLTASELEAWILYGGGQALWDELAAQFRIKPIMAGNTGTQMGGWFTREINSLDDLTGLKMRIPGLGGEVLRQLGVLSVVIAPGEILPALQSGAVDAVELVGPWSDLAAGLYKAAKFYYYPGFHEPGPSLTCGINMAVWESFSATDQAIITAACHAENSHMIAEYNAHNGAALDTLVNKHGVRLEAYPDDVFDALGKVSEEVVAAFADGDDLSRRIYDSYALARKTVGNWLDRSDRAFAAHRKRTLG
jgi:TRAP-type mannitol/chloroaromatic compound transport system substrate-binding protein